MAKKRKRLHPYMYDGKIIRILDGDTYEIEIDLGFYLTITRICRLAGIDTPETRGKNKTKKALEIKENMVKLILNKEFEMNVIKLGKFGRPLIDLYLNPKTKYTLTNRYTS